MSASETHSRLTTISDQLWEEHAYADGELDRVVLVVELEVQDDKGNRVWHQLRSIDDKGNDQGTSMARLVSHTVSLAVQSSLEGEFEPGVHAAPSDTKRVYGWLEELSALNGGFKHQVFV